MKATLGKMLLSAGVVKSAQLEEAVQNQVIFGGRLGTNLLELGYVSLGLLSKALSKKHNCPTINPFRLRPPQPEVVKLLGRKLAAKHEVVPLALDGNSISLLMSDPADVNAFDEIQFATGKRIKPYVSPEIVVQTLREKYYGIPRDHRYKHLASKVLKRKPSGASPQKQGSKPPPKEHPDIKGLDFELKEDLSSQEDFEKLLNEYNRSQGLVEGEAAESTSAPAQETPAQPQAPAHPPPAPDTQPPPPPESHEKAATPPPQEAQETEKAEAAPHEAEEEILDLEDIVSEPLVAPSDEEIEEEAEEEAWKVQEALSPSQTMEKLNEVTDREELSNVVLRFALSYFKRAALFITRSGIAMGWDGLGGSLNTRTVQGIMIPLNSPGIFQTVHDSMSFYLGSIPNTPLNERFLKLTGGEKPRSAFLIPILFKGKVVNILYGDNGDGQDAPTDISDLLILAPRIPQAFEALIKKKKQQAREEKP